MDERILGLFEDSLRRCNADPGFIDRFYELFLMSSPKVREKFAGTDFVRQKQMLQASLHLLLVAARDDGKRPTPLLDEVAARHGASEMAIGAELYDLWLDSLLKTVKACDAGWSEEDGDGRDEEHERVDEVHVRHGRDRYEQDRSGPEQVAGDEDLLVVPAIDQRAGHRAQEQVRQCRGHEDQGRRQHRARRDQDDGRERDLVDPIAEQRDELTGP
jgi:hypothetical protein